MDNLELRFNLFNAIYMIDPLTSVSFPSDGKRLSFSFGIQKIIKLTLTNFNLEKVIKSEYLV